MTKKLREFVNIRDNCEASSFCKICVVFFLSRTKIILRGLSLKFYIRRFRHCGFINTFQCSQIFLTATGLKMIERCGKICGKQARYRRQGLLSLGKGNFRPTLLQTLQLWQALCGDLVGQHCNLVWSFDGIQHDVLRQY